MTTVLRVLVMVVCVVFCTADVHATTKRIGQRDPSRLQGQKVHFDPTQEMVYVRYELLALFWRPHIEPPLAIGVRGITPYAGLNAWLAHKVATGCVPCELPAEAKQKYCNYWIEDQLTPARDRVFRISPDGWCHPMRKE
jgi:hypothetical protein